MNTKPRGEWGYMKRKIVWGKVKHPCYFLLKTSLKLVSSKNKIGISFCPAFQTAPFSPIRFNLTSQKDLTNTLG
jgi:hypothetical protein